MSKKKYYLSIPITGYDLKERRETAMQAKKKIENMFGVDVVTPFDIKGIDQDSDYEHCMGCDIEELLRCDAIFMMPWWEESCGCKAEHAVARVYEIMTYYYDKTEGML